MIAPAYGGSHEAYIEEATGVAPADESAEALTRTLDDLLEDPARLAWMGRHVVQWTRQAFDRNAMRSSRPGGYCDPRGRRPAWEAQSSHAPAAGNARRIRPGHGVVRGALMIGGIGQPAHASGPGLA